MRDISINLQDHRVTVVESPDVKRRLDGSPVLDRDGATQFVVSVFVKRLPIPGQRAPKGEEVRVTLGSDPGEIAEGEWVEFIDPRVSPWEMRDEATGRVSSGLSFRAAGMKVAGSQPMPVAVEPSKKHD
jgi:hypothetical protein